MNRFVRALFLKNSSDYSMRIRFYPGIILVQFINFDFVYFTWTITREYWNELRGILTIDIIHKPNIQPKPGIASGTIP